MQVGAVYPPARFRMRQLTTQPIVAFIAILVSVFGGFRTMAHVASADDAVEHIAASGSAQVLIPEQGLVRCDRAAFLLDGDTVGLSLDYETLWHVGAAEQVLLSSGVVTVPSTSLLRGSAGGPRAP